MSKNPGIRSHWLNRLKEKLPDRQVGLAPATAFFTRKVDLPENLSWADKTAFIELYLEGNAPFPVEQLAWGYLQHPSSGHALVYATPKARLKGLDFENPEAFFQLFPGFITLFGEIFAEATVRFLSQSGELSALFLQAGNPVPEKVISRRINGELPTDDVLIETREKMRQSLPTEDWIVEDGLWHGEKSEILPGGAVRFRHRHISEGESEGIKDFTPELSGDALWAADLRDTAYATREQKSRQRSTVIWKSLRAAAVTAVILLLFQVLLLGISVFNAFRENRIAELEPGATRVENKLTLAQRLTQSTEEDLQPFLLLESINPLRPDSVYFDKVRSRAFNQLEVEGQSAEGVTPFNAFSDAIGKLSFVSEVDPNPQTRNNQTTFDLEITFSSLPPEPEGGFIIPEEEDEESGGDTEVEETQG